MKPSIIGRERSLMDKLANEIVAAVQKRHPVTDLREDRRGSHFEVQITLDDEPTGHVARVTIELDRLEERP
jgi:hypothetical protein